MLLRSELIGNAIHQKQTFFAIEPQLNSLCQVMFFQMQGKDWPNAVNNYMIQGTIKSILLKLLITASPPIKK